MGLQLYLPWGDFIERQLVPGLLNKGSEGRLDGSWKSVQITERAHVRVRLSIRPQPFFTGCLSVSGMVLSAQHDTYHRRDSRQVDSRYLKHRDISKYILRNYVKCHEGKAQGLINITTVTSQENGENSVKPLKT